MVGIRKTYAGTHFCTQIIWNPFTLWTFEFVSTGQRAFYKLILILFVRDKLINKRRKLCQLGKTIVALIIHEFNQFVSSGFSRMMENGGDLMVQIVMGPRSAEFNFSR